jgi:nucleotide-binding universal stress UspA family protein
MIGWVTTFSTENPDDGVRMFRSVLVSMDLSPATEALISVLPQLREFGTEELTLVHVAKPLQDPVSKSLRAVEDVRARLNNLAEGLSGYGFTVSVAVPSGVPAVEVAKAAAARQPDVLMVGTRSHTRIHEAFVGSVAWEVVQKSDRPVLLQRIEANRPDPEAALLTRGSGLPDHVVHPTDFSEMASRAVPWLSKFAKKGVSAFTLLHVLPDGGEDGRKAAQDRLDEMARRLQEDGAAKVDVQVRMGVPHEEVLRFGGRKPDSLVVMGTHGKGFLPEMMVGSVSRQVVRHASARVLLVPAAPE